MDYNQEICKNKPNIKLVERKIANITNTGTKFSNSSVSGITVSWIVAYTVNEGEHVHRIMAYFILDLLEENIKNLGLIQNYENTFNDFLNKNKFMERYFKAMRNCFKEIPKVDIITEISLHNYEKRESCGIVYFLEDDSLIAGEMIHFDKECLFQGGFQKRENVQGIRKLLEICRNGNCSLVVLASGESEESEGSEEKIIGVICRQKEWGDIQVVSIHFRGSQWKLFCGEELILEYRNGSYYIDIKDKKLNLEEKCKEGGLSYEIFGRLFELLEDEAHHGALVIVAKDAKEEVDRLCVQYGRGIKLADIVEGDRTEKEICLSKDEQENEDKLRTVLSMANLDGAIFFDYEGNCHGFSVILDGKAKVKGDKERGARYNSAINYIANTEANKPRCAVIRSEDIEKGIEIIPSSKYVNNWT